MTWDPELWQLLHDGDWACAEGDEEALERVTGAVARRLERGPAVLARAVGALAARDMTAASALWGRLAASLRADAAALSQPGA